jgi:hypothetical protein
LFCDRKGFFCLRVFSLSPRDDGATT